MSPKQYKSLAFSLLFITLILMSNLRFSAMYVYYSVAKEDFIERLCENKDKPQLNCDGKCMLSQMLVAQSEEEEQPLPTIGWEQLVLFLPEYPNYVLADLTKTNEVNHYPQTNYSFNFIVVPYKPPIF
ncbi:hypothetical protein GTQ34_08550 [Muricauda sp. JGD-17]|uniref:Uncharacterized protein n=1 Tax=Flagellimonas ochracea TaxID=2696472 RepID=A0A964TEF7_9FLAO|nr:hypothetical protein [Allomuricauda ochracea]NAY91966.1 hypothetical protein [Allomuricauda ochracea]